MGTDTLRITNVILRVTRGLGEIPDPQLNPVVLLMTAAQDKTQWHDGRGKMPNRGFTLNQGVS